MHARRKVLCAGAAMAAFWCAAALGQAYPSKPIQLVVAFAPGGAGDIVARLVARKMGEDLGRPVVVENRPVPVASAALVASAKPDGHTLLMAGSGTALTSALFNRLPYDLAKDFRHISTLSSFDLVLVAGRQQKFRTVADVIAYAKAHPGQLALGTARVGSTQNLAGELFRSMAGVDVLIVPYKTTGDLVSAVRAGDVQVALEMLPAVLGPVQNRTIHPLAVTALKRFARLPDVPTVSESGLPGFEAASWNGISVPAATPPQVVQRIHSAVVKAVADPGLQRELLDLGFVAQASTPEQMAQRMQADTRKWADVIAKAHIQRH